MSTWTVIVRLNHWLQMPLHLSLQFSNTCRSSTGKQNFWTQRPWHFLNCFLLASFSSEAKDFNSSTSASTAFSMSRLEKCLTLYFLQFISRENGRRECMNKELDFLFLVTWLRQTGRRTVKQTEGNTDGQKEEGQAEKHTEWLTDSRTDI